MATRGAFFCEAAPVDCSLGGDRIRDRVRASPGASFLPQAHTATSAKRNARRCIAETLKGYLRPAILPRGSRPRICILSQMSENACAIANGEFGANNKVVPAASGQHRP